MRRQSPFLLLLLVAFVFSPTLLSWVIDTGGVWYRPFIIWLAIIIIAFFVQHSAAKKRDL